MLFNSYIFVLLFLPLTVIIYHLINKTGHHTLGKVFLLMMSLWFYCYTDFQNVFVLLGSIAVNYVIAEYVFCINMKLPLKKLVLGLSVAANLALLIWFKYTGFLADIINSLSGSSFKVENLIFPLGISFFTFSQISYLVDSYRAGKPGETSFTPDKIKDPVTRYSFLDYALFVSFFPKVSVGPIAFAREIIPQFNDKLKKTADYGNISKGLMMFSFGLAKKVLIADNMALIADFGYEHIDLLDTPLALIVILAYSMQLYFDFSGFCDMASGICLMINIDLPVNFNSPYRALSINDFWKRWHITLTRFFREYVYFPLGGSRKGTFRTYLNIFIIFFLSGIWHGANYTFVLWGAIHGLGMCLSKALSGITEKLPKAVRFILTYTFVSLTWVFFRADSVESAIEVFRRLFSFEFKPIVPAFVVSALPVEGELFQWILAKHNPANPTTVTGFIIILLPLLFALTASVKMKNAGERAQTFKPSRKYLTVTVILLVWSVLSLSEVTTFLYTNF
ncbi:MAG: MBOAT family protein [Lachnospiraceae bacterium]|nr:MBOAT family protein [Lachnospiraceae bacterium]